MFKAWCSCPATNLFRIAIPCWQGGPREESAWKSFPPPRDTPARWEACRHCRATEASAQVKSCVLFAGLLAQGTKSVEESVRTRDHGELALRAFGAEVQQEKNRSSIRGRQELHAIKANVPGDISSASFFMCAAALFPESNLVLENVGLNPTRSSLLDVLTALGARVRMLALNEANYEVTGSVKVEAGLLKGTSVSGGQQATLIADLPVLAAIAPYTQEGVEIRGAGELRVRESRRIATRAQGRRATGAQVGELSDGVRVPGKQKLHGA